MDFSDISLLYALGISSEMKTPPDAAQGLCDKKTKILCIIVTVKAQTLKQEL